MLDKRVQQARKERILIEIAEAYQGYDIRFPVFMAGVGFTARALP